MNGLNERCVVWLGSWGGTPVSHHLARPAGRLALFGDQQFRAEVVVDLVDIVVAQAAH
jgi:hypothetical protein